MSEVKLLSKAELLSQKKQRERPRRNPKAKSERVLWTTKLAEQREALNLSMKDVADAVNLSQSAYFRIEHGFADVSLSNAMSIAQFFGRTVYELWPQWRGEE